MAGGGPRHRYLADPRRTVTGMDGSGGEAPRPRSLRLVGEHGGVRQHMGASPGTVADSTGPDGSIDVIEIDGVTRCNRCVVIAGSAGWYTSRRSPRSADRVALFGYPITAGRTMIARLGGEGVGCRDVTTIGEDVETASAGPAPTPVELCQITSSPSPRSSDEKGEWTAAAEIIGRLAGRPLLSPGPAVIVSPAKADISTQPR